jgi:hypothetical protein
MHYRKLHLKVNWGFPYKADWTHSFSYMFFLGLPIRAVPIDGPAQ